MASKKSDIPRNTLRNKRSGQYSKKVGRPTVFPEEEISFEGYREKTLDVHKNAKFNFHIQSVELSEFYNHVLSSQRINDQGPCKLTKKFWYTEN